MLWLPTASDEIANVAAPAPSSAPVPRTVAPSLNVAVPVGVPAPGAVAETVAVNVVLPPVTVGLTDETTAVLVAALLMVCENAADVLAGKTQPPPP